MRWYTRFPRPPPKEMEVDRFLTLLNSFGGSTMSSTFRFAALAVALSLTVGACSEQSTPTAATDVISGASFNFSNGPGNPGMSGVFRFEDVFVTFTTDPNRDVLAAHFQADDAFFCGGGSFFEFSDLQIVNNQDDVFRAVSQLVNAPLFLYELSTFPPPGDPDECRAFAEDWLYQGTHSMVVRDNDLSLGGKGANSFAWQGHGTVYDPSGASHQYSETQTALIGPNFSFFVFINENIRVTP